MIKSATAFCGVLLCSAFGGCTPRPTAGTGEPPGSPAEGPRDPYICVMADGRLRNVRATYDPDTRDTLYNGRPFREDTAGYAGTRPWYVTSEPITWDGRRYTKYGPPRVLPSDSLRRAGEHQGVPFFVEANTSGTPGVIYVPTRPGCEFHLYQWDLTSGGIRGKR